MFDFLPAAVDVPSQHAASMPATSPRCTGRLGPLVALGVLVAAVLSGCASSRPPVASSPDAASVPNPDRTAQQLRTATAQWAGTPYVLGGTSRRGIDCSAFVQVLYRDVLGLPLPRTTQRQAQAGRSVPVDEAQPGDLVFFRPARKLRHVGVYLGEGEFAHASTSQGVMISRLEEPYWQDAYWMTRRILPDLPETTSASPPASDSPSPPRAGW